MREKSALPFASYARGSGCPKTRFAVWLMLARGSNLFHNAEYDDTDVVSATTSSKYVWEDAC